jgi:hypothetical protein
MCACLMFAPDALAGCSFVFNSGVFEDASSVDVIGLCCAS